MVLIITSAICKVHYFACIYLISIFFLGDQIKSSDSDSIQSQNTTWVIFFHRVVLAMGFPRVALVLHNGSKHK